MWCFIEGAARAAEVVSSEIVSDDQDDVGRSIRGCQVGRQNAGEKQQQGNAEHGGSSREAVSKINAELAGICNWIRRMRFYGFFSVSSSALNFAGRISLINAV